MAYPKDHSLFGLGLPGFGFQQFLCCLQVKSEELGQKGYRSLQVTVANKDPKLGIGEPKSVTN